MKSVDANEQEKKKEKTKSKDTDQNNFFASNFSKRKTLIKIFYVIIFILLYLTFKSKIELIIDKLWVEGIILTFENYWYPFALLVIILIVVAAVRIKAKDFIPRISDLLILSFYLNYRFFDNHWLFKRFSPHWQIVYFDIVPLFLLTVILISAKNAYKHFNNYKLNDGLIDPDRIGLAAKFLAGPGTKPTLSESKIDAIIDNK